ncbi:hypothetical protein AVEN_140768-1 [Araneus ventricosus]|uniref:Uncharacterized protein n=1 Tax=Araneus ventricosus TaxID=182803 RepID=A0A4Y2F0W0_ARAVE|nr:hypothetical protein AVEN_140768-1 [Araneus ventricosus]
MGWYTVEKTKFSNSPHHRGRRHLEKTAQFLDFSLSLQNTAATFINPQATTEQVTEARENVLVTLYGKDTATQNLDELRYHSFVKAAAKTKFNVARLPPTTDAAQLHAMRSYHQLQTWLGNEKDPLNWG